MDVKFSRVFCQHSFSKCIALVIFVRLTHSFLKRERKVYMYKEKGKVYRTSPQQQQ